jgi:AcrR family transcriptional regulator
MTEPRAEGSTRDRIVEAALRTIREAGFADTTARAIARTGGFNQALIFYHFGSLDSLLHEAFAEASAPEERAALLERFDGWIRLVQDALERAMAGSPLTAVAPVREAAYAICAMFLGIELMSRLDPERSEADAVFDMMEGMARLIEDVAAPLLGSS